MICTRLKSTNRSSLHEKRGAQIESEAAPLLRERKRVAHHYRRAFRVGWRVQCLGQDIVDVAAVVKSPLSLLLIVSDIISAGGLLVPRPNLEISS